MTNKTLVTLLLDRSASMSRHKAATLAGINEWLAKLRKTEDDMRFSLVQFDHWEESPRAPSEHAPDQSVPAGEVLGGGAYGRAGGLHGRLGGGFLGGLPTSGARHVMHLEKTHVAVPVRDVSDLTEADFLPRGNTPLIDAAVTTIRAIEESLTGRSDVKVVLAIQTDGQENKSVENTWDDLKALVAEKEKLGWEILFMGAGIDAYDQGARMGVARSKTLSYGVGAAETRAAFGATAEKTVLYSAGAAASMAYTAEEKLRAGDAG